MKRRRIQSQPRSDRPRTPLSASFLDAISDAVEKEARRWDVSRSFVIATAVADSLGVDEQPHYILSKRKLKLVG